MEGKSINFLIDITSKKVYSGTNVFFVPYNLLTLASRLGFKSTFHFRVKSREAYVVMYDRNDVVYSFVCEYCSLNETLSTQSH